MTFKKSLVGISLSLVAILGVACGNNNKTLATVTTTTPVATPAPTPQGILSASIPQNVTRCNMSSLEGGIQGSNRPDSVIDGKNGNWVLKLITVNAFFHPYSGGLISSVLTTNSLATNKTPAGNSPREVFREASIDDFYGGVSCHNLRDLDPSAEIPVKAGFSDSKNIPDVISRADGSYTDTRSFRFSVSAGSETHSASSRVSHLIQKDSLYNHFDQSTFQRFVRAGSGSDERLDSIVALIYKISDNEMEIRTTLKQDGISIGSTDGTLITITAARYMAQIIL